MNLEISIEVDQSFTVHVDFIELAHANYYNQSLVFEMQAEFSPPQCGPLPRTRPSSHPLLELEIELENGSKAYISPQPCDEPVRLATEFCEEHNLDTDMIDILAESIKKSIHRSHQQHQEPQLPLPHSQNASQSCKTQNSLRSHQYFSKKFSVNSSLGLYQKGLMLEDAKKHWIARQHERKVQEEMRQCTHHPKINQLSRSLITQRDSNSQLSQEKVEGRKPSQNISSLRTSILIECPPAILPPSSHLSISSLPKSSSVFAKLYDARKPDEISRSKVLQQMMREETYHPSINDISKEIVGSATFSQRLLKYERDKKEKSKKRKRMEQEEKENMHHPKTGQPPQNRNLQGLPIGDFLYAKKKKTQVLRTEPQQPHINQTSKVIYNKRKLVAFQRIFQHLCGKRANQIQWKSLDIGRVDPSLLAIIHPLLEEIEIMQIELNLHDFKAAMDFLFASLSLTDKGVILNFGVGKQADDPPNTKPVVNKNSEAIARSMGRCRISIYDYCSIKQAIKLQRIQQERVQQQRREMSECTFEPRIDRKPIYY